MWHPMYVLAILVIPILIQFIFQFCISKFHLYRIVRFSDQASTYYKGEFHIFPYLGECMFSIISTMK